MTFLILIICLWYIHDAGRPRGYTARPTPPTSKPTFTGSRRGR